MTEFTGTDDLQELSRAIQMACLPSSPSPIGQGRQKLVELPRALVIKSVLAVANDVLSLDDEWQYRRFIEALSLVRASTALVSTVRSGLQSASDGVREAANDWIEACMVWPDDSRATEEWFPADLVSSWSDITDGFDILEDELMYYDAPLAGFLRSKTSGNTFAFECIEVLPACTWQWILVPSRHADIKPQDVIEPCLADLTSKWMSIIEDLRSGVRKFTAACAGDGSSMAPPWTGAV